MDKSDRFKEDILRQYINPDKIEKAPEGFTERLMNRIQVENESSVFTVPNRTNIKLLVTSGLIFVILIILAILFPPTEKESVISLVPDQLKNIQIVFPEINFGKLSDFTLPAWITYITLGISFLILFDLILNKLFHRERK